MPPFLKRPVLKIIFIYFLVGFIYSMIGEFRLNMKYSLILNGKIDYPSVCKDTITNPYGYIRSCLRSIYWPIELYFTIYHFHNLFGPPLRDRL